MEITKANKETVNILQELLQKNYDAEAGYKQIMQKAENNLLKNWLQIKAKQRSQFANELDSLIRDLNATPVADGSLLGSAHRAWIDLKTTLSSNTDEAILEECIRGEKASVDEYENQLEKVSNYSDINNVIYKQLVDIKTALNTVKRLEDIAN
ncbi:PA2169 family four-helix-bundle protein [Mariniflexile litorale]|uniref:PA2169 family four-helix-bundle protein n=1 Tax=Mariniflexile litorale TaxID=3045158 RepID=A0AAU7EG69_9FLAO|nr:PA2169 family four-helix-bundle protein [Mariniflexile sp. KMM 9835]MDQ8210176.1 PA2169 family four-helix-bundle protein [Mariniflexile sp. KMM 9835]